MLDTNDPRFDRGVRLDDERQKVARLLAELEAQGFGDDDQLLLDAIEGETDAMEAVSKLLRHIGESEALAASVKAYEGDLAARRKRYEDRVKNARLAILNFMQEFGLKKIERPEATLSYRDGGVKVAFAADFDATSLPKDLLKISIDPDKTKIKDALTGGAELSGCYLTNGEPILTMRVK
jgi:hypothetical protein